MTEKMETIIDEYNAGSIKRRRFLDRLIAVTGSMAAAHLLLESTGLANTLLSEVESGQIKVSSETVTYSSVAGVSVSGYLSTPQGKGKFPAVIVIHENRGLNEHTR